MSTSHRPSRRDSLHVEFLDPIPGKSPCPGTPIKELHEPYEIFVKKELQGIPSAGEPASACYVLFLPSC